MASSVHGNNHDRIFCTQHIEVDLYFVRDKVATGAVHVVHVPTPSHMSLSSPRGWQHLSSPSFVPVSMFVAKVLRNKGKRGWKLLLAYVM